MNPRSSQSLVNTVYTLYLFNFHRELGRYRLAQELGVSKDQTRTIIKRLVDINLIQKVSQRQGHELSSEGKELLDRCQEYLHIPMVRVYFGSDYTLGTKDAVVCLEASDIDQINTVILRDEALLAGSMGCTVFFQDSSGEYFLLNVTYPPLPSNPLTSKNVKNRLRRVTQGLLWKEILIIVGTADTTILAQKGAIAAGLLLLPEDLKQQLMT